MAEADPDGDGFTNESEFLAGTDPTDPASLLRLQARLSSPAELEITWSAVAGRAYQVEQTAGLGASNAWTAVSGTLTDGVFRHPILSEPGAFYRVRLVVP